MNIIHRVVFLIFSALLIGCQQNTFCSDLPELADRDLSTYYTGKVGLNTLLFTENFSLPIQSYTICSTGEASQYDPSDWVLKGSYDGCTWVVLDERQNQRFISRFQEITYKIETPSNYKQYLLEATTGANDSLKIAEVCFSERNECNKWGDFAYPAVIFRMEDPEVEGSRIYQELVQDPEAYIRYHARKVAEILYYTAHDSMPDIRRIGYVLKEYDGISAKSGGPPEIFISYSTRHVEHSAAESLFKLDYETRGVLYHELVHGYQFEPKGIGSYSTNKEFWACIEGVADAVRAEAGFFDVKALRKPGGHWLDGYKTTGFFLQWLTTKDPDAIRKFNITVRDLEIWSFDKAIKSIFGEDTGIETMWDEYQVYLSKENC